MEENKSEQQNNSGFAFLKFEKPLLQNRFPGELLVSHSPDIQFFDMTPWNAGKGMIPSYSPDLKQVEDLIYDSHSPNFEQDSNFQQNIGTYYPYNEYNPDANFNEPFSTKFPRAHNYDSLEAIQEVFPHLANINDSQFDMQKVSPDAHFYLMRSSNDDNIHKAIKYHIWTTTASGKQTLSKAWNSFKEKGREPEIYLIFSVVESNHFLGIAKLASNIDDNATFKYWWEPCKWFGTFQVEWFFIKDIHYNKFEHFKQEVSDNPRHLSSVVNLRDTTKINNDIGKKILEIFVKHSNSPNIFESFLFMDRREDFMRFQRDQDEEFQKVFEESCTYYKQNPERFRPQTNQNYQRRDHKRNSQRSNQSYKNQKNYNPQHNTSNQYQPKHEHQSQKHEFEEAKTPQKGTKESKEKTSKGHKPTKEKVNSQNIKEGKGHGLNVHAKNFYQKH